MYKYCRHLNSMRPKVLIQFDDATLKAVDRIPTDAGRVSRPAGFGSGLGNQGPFPRNGRNETIRDLAGGTARTGRQAFCAVAETQ
jgi:hypothetical protein